MCLPQLIAMWRQKHWQHCTRNEKSSVRRISIDPKTSHQIKFSNGFINEFCKRFQTIAFNGWDSFFRIGSKNGADVKIKRRPNRKELNASLYCLKKVSLTIIIT